MADPTKTTKTRKRRRESSAHELEGESRPRGGSSGRKPRKRSERGEADQEVAENASRKRDGGSSRRPTPERVARGLGWLSLALGVGSLLGARRTARWIGLRREALTPLRLVGVREIATGIGLLAARRPAAAQWARVGGDVVDLGLLGAALSSRRAERGRVGALTAGVAAITALDVACVRRLTAQDPDARSGRLQLSRSIAIDRPAIDLYAQWRDLENLPRFMPFLSSVRPTTRDGSAEGGEAREGGQLGSESSMPSFEWNARFVAKGPMGLETEWEAEIVDDVPGEVIAWCSTPDAALEHSGAVQFEPTPDQRGTLVRVEIEYQPPGGLIAASLAKLFEPGPAWVIQDSLRRFKQLMEVGEIVTTEGQPSGREGGASS